MIEIDVEIDAKRVELFFRGLETKGLDAASARALNKVAITVRQRAVQEVFKVRRIRKTDIKKSMQIVRANRRLLESRVRASNRPLSLKAYKAKLGGRKGHKRVVVNITGKRQVLEHAFILEGKGGHVFERKGSKSLPIRRLSGPSIGSAMVKGAVKNVLRGVIRERWPVVYKREVEFEIRKLSRR